MKSDRRLDKRRETAQLLRRIDPTVDVNAALAQYEKKRRRRLLLLSAAVLLLALCAAFAAGGNVLGEGGILKRNAAGEGSYIVSLIASIQGKDRIAAEITVSEQALTGTAVQELFDAASEELQQTMLGENESADCVMYDLTLPTETADGMVEAEWSFDNYQVISSDGTIREDVSEDGELVEITLTMTYLEETAQTVFSVLVYPAPVSEEEALEAALEEALAEADESTVSEDSLVLPDEVNGLAVIWSTQKAYLGWKVLLLGLAVILFVEYEEKEKLNRAAARRDAQMMADYADIVNKLSLLLAAGMTVYGAWERIVTSHMKEAGQDTEKRIAYEEMKITYLQIREGAGERGAYEEFGRRCGLRPYLKLSAILTQNLKLGTAGITAKLAEEASEAFEQRKALARQRGEEAGTRLLMPMMMLLGVVLAIVAIPGFLSF